jgi:Flp pilus assembly pilin Flp
MEDMASFLVGLISDDDGQDLIEYALLTAFIAIAGILGFQAIGLAINTSYTSWDTTNQDLWEPPPPTSGN